MITVSIDDFLYKYFDLFRYKTSISVYDLNSIKFMVDKYQQSIFLDFCKDELTSIYIDFFYSVKDNGMMKRYDIMNLEEDTIRNYITIPDIVIQCMILYERKKKISKLIKKVS